MGKKLVYDSIIIGAGPAGLTAALYLGRYEKKVLLVTKDLGGQAATSGEVGNYPGFDLISGEGLSNKIAEQLKQYKNLTFKYPSEVSSINKTDRGFEVKIETESFEAKTVLIAAGKRHRTLGLPGEEKLVGKGLSYCATCDGPFAKGKETVVIGGGNAAADAAMILGRIAAKVTVLNLNESMAAEQVRIEKLNGMKNVVLINQAKTTKIEDQNGLVSAVVYEDSQGRGVTLKTDMVFVEIGYIPNTEKFADLVELNKAGEIIINKDNSTKTPLLFSAGDITDVMHKQIIIACGEGAKAAMSINLALEK